MGYLWSSKAKEDAEMSKCALGERATGDIATAIIGETLDSDLIYLGCRMAKAAKCKIHFLHVIQVPRTLPLKAILAYESERADQLLNAAMEIAYNVGSEAIPQVVQARDVGSAIIDEICDHHCALLLIGLVRDRNTLQSELSKTVNYVLSKAPCRVWLLQDPPILQQEGNYGSSTSIRQL